jgi:hypothetical protein
MTNGVQSVEFSGLNLSCAGGSNSACIYVYMDGTQGESGALTFRNMGFTSCTDGILAGYQSTARCDNGMLINCTFTYCTTAGLRIVSQNAVNWQVYGGGGFACGTDVGSGLYAALYSVIQGSLSPIVGASMSVNGADITNLGAQQITVIGGSSESKVCAFLGASQLHMSGFAWRWGDPGSGTFIDASNQGFVKLDACTFAPNNTTNVHTIVAMGNNGVAVIDQLEWPTSAGTIHGFTGAGAKLYLRGCDFPAAATPFSGYTGPILELDTVLNTTVSALPTAAAKYKGLRGSVTDGAASLAWGATVTGGGSTFYEVVCNGSAWTVSGK